MNRILWVDDEIDLLQPYIIYLKNKGYEVVSASNGEDALQIVKGEKGDGDNHFNIVFLDENMPGMTGLETLQEIKRLRPEVPVVMITKSEEEHIMEQAIGEKIADYLIKPVNPSQILLCLKKHIHQLLEAWIWIELAITVFLPSIEQISAAYHVYYHLKLSC